MDDLELRIMEEDGTMRTIRASYGIMRVLQLRHVSALKHHYPSMHFFSNLVPRGRYRQGTPRLGEGELLSMMMQDMPSNVRDAITSSGMCEVDVCSGCSMLPLWCQCEVPRPPMTKIMASYSHVILDVFATLYMLNTPEKHQVAMKYITSLSPT